MAEILHQNYPHLLFRKQWDLTESALLYLGQCEAYVKAINNTPILPEHYNQLMNVAMLKGAQSTTAIEGNTLTDEEVQKIIDNQRLPPSKEYQEIEVKNILDAFNELLNEVVHDGKDQMISVELIKRFHRLVGKELGEHFEAVPGQLRNAEVVVGRYRCPDHRDVPILLNELCAWLKNEFKYGEKEQSFSDVVLQAIVTHIYIEWIHPFGDGNGRTGRLVEFYIMLRGGNPDIASHILSNYYNLTRPNYYRQIEKATETKSLTHFIEYAVIGLRDGLVNTLEIIQASQFLNTWQKLIYDTFADIRQVMHDQVFRRQRTLALEIPINKIFTPIQIADISIPLAKLYANVHEKTIQRDIDNLIEMKLVRKVQDGYLANTGLLGRMMAKRKKVEVIKGDNIN